MYKIAILDDYFSAALTSADWTILKPKCSTAIFTEHFDNEKKAVNELRNFDIIVTMSERMQFTDSLLKKLPDLKLLISMKMDNPAIDLCAAMANGVLVCAMSDLDTQPTNGSVFKVNGKSQVDTKSTIVIRVSYDGGSNYIAIAEYTIAEEDDSSFTFATYDANSELGNTAQLNTEQVNNMTFLITNSLGIIHDLNVTIDDGTGGRIRISDGRVFFRDGRVRI